MFFGLFLVFLAKQFHSFLAAKPFCGPETTSLALKPYLNRLRKIPWLVVNLTAPESPDSAVGKKLSDFLHILINFCRFCGWGAIL